MPDVAQQIHDSRPQPEQVSTLDVQRLIRRARRRAALTYASSGMAAVVVVVGLAAGLSALNSDQVELSPAGSGGQTTGGGPDEAQDVITGDRPDASANDATGQQLAAAWEGLSLRQAVEQLTGVARSHPDPVVPPPEGMLARIRTLSASQEQGSLGTPVMQVNDRMVVIDAAGRGSGTHGGAAVPMPADDIGRGAVIDLIEGNRPVRDRELPSNAGESVGYAWPDAGSVAAAVERARRSLSEDGSLDPESAAMMSKDPNGRQQLLRLLADNEEAVTYRGLVPDLLNRPAVAFSASLPGNPQGVATVLFSPESGQPVGWESHSGEEGWTLHSSQLELASES